MAVRRPSGAERAFSAGSLFLPGMASILGVAAMLAPLLGTGDYGPALETWMLRALVGIPGVLWLAGSAVLGDVLLRPGVRGDARLTLAVTAGGPAGATGIGLVLAGLVALFSYGMSVGFGTLDLVSWLSVLLVLVTVVAAIVCVHAIAHAPLGLLVGFAHLRWADHVQQSEAWDALADLPPPIP
ncbi:MAG: hypothetical protein R3F61_02800 [Myxococcota bacterium]